MDIEKMVMAWLHGRNQWPNGSTVWLVKVQIPGKSAFHETQGIYIKSEGNNNALTLNATKCYKTSNPTRLWIATLPVTRTGWHISPGISVTLPEWLDSPDVRDTVKEINQWLRTKQKNS